MKLIEAVLCWNPGTADVFVVQDSNPSDHLIAGVLRYSSLACYSNWTTFSDEQRKVMMLIEAMQAIVRDKCDPMAVHRALLRIEEYQQLCASDMPDLPKHELVRRLENDEL